MKPMIKVEDREEPLYLYEAISGNVMIRAEDMDKVVGSRKYQRWRLLTCFEKMKLGLGLTIKNLDYVGD